MRLLIAAGALSLLATTATAQRLDTRRINLRDTGTNKICDYNAYPITLIDSGKAESAFATWRQPPQDAKPGAQDRFEFVFGYAPDWRKPASVGIGARIYADAEINTDTVGSARFLFDGQPAAASYHASGSEKLIFAIGPNLDGWSKRLVDTDTLDLEIMNNDGRILRSYRWDVRRLGEGLETVAVTQWSCTSP